VIPFVPLGDRVVIQADREDHAPTVTDSGVVLAKTLTAAVEGEDAEDSWFVGTVVAVGPLVNRFEIRPYVLKRLQTLLTNDDWRADRVLGQLQGVVDTITALPTDCPDPIAVGDRVTFSWASGQQITVDGERFLIMRASEVLAVLVPESEAA